MNTDDELWQFGSWLMAQGLLKNIFEKPDDTRGISRLVQDFRDLKES